jgi:hypothetical protein
MLVHTGEKRTHLDFCSCTNSNHLTAYSCNTCPRRFGVASNLNRHKRICPRSNDTASLGVGPSVASVSHPSICERSSSLPQPTARTHRRLTNTIDRPRRNRRPQPRPLWIPSSLRFFDLTPIPKSVPVPLPPMHTFTNEEHNLFFDEFHVGEMPYHPNGWRGYLPGPAPTIEAAMGPGGGGHLLVF